MAVARTEATARLTPSLAEVRALADDKIAAVADAYKLLVIWRPDRGSDKRRRTVTRFLEACRRRKRPAIVEGIVRPALGRESLSPAQHTTAVLAAARELGELPPDLYKAEVPTLGASADDVVTDAARELSAIVRCPWVVLSNGTPADRFADAAIRSFSLRNLGSSAILLIPVSAQ